MIRHAQPAWTETGVGALDPDLTELGHRQSEALARRLAAGEPYDELLFSTAARASSTAEPIARELGLEPVPVPNLVECGMANGVPVTAVEDLPRIPGWDQQYKGERFDRFHHRITAGLTGLLEARGVAPGSRAGWWEFNVATPRRTLLVAHGGVNSVVTACLLGLEPIPQPWDRFLPPHASISRFEAHKTDRGWVFALRSHADTTHLVDLGVTY